MKILNQSLLRRPWTSFPTLGWVKPAFLSRFSIIFCVSYILAAQSSPSFTRSEKQGTRQFMDKVYNGVSLAGGCASGTV